MLLVPALPMCQDALDTVVTRFEHVFKSLPKRTFRRNVLLLSGSGPAAIKCSIASIWMISREKSLSCAGGRWETTTS